ncbi:tyrosine-type recombinase/integrase [uncultured Veillonella sp.]|uniref:tyrosine-type recombinase/integrase n=1 Tax=uncultured Veillonella sp. TaxID=159268 RepID=UPI00339025B6
MSELRGLKWDDIDLKTGKIYIKRAVVLVTSLQQDIITDTKGKRIGEFVQIPESFIPVIEEYVRENKGKSEWVFTNDNGNIISYSMFRYYARIIVSKLGIDKGFCLHLYRHAHASLLVKNNVDLKTIQAQLRHTNIETTSRYLHELTPSNRPSISKIDI